MNENPTNAEEQYELGRNYDYGYSGLLKDREKAVYWYTKAAEQGHAEAQYNLGAFYFEGKDVPQDLQKAVYWHTKAAEQGYATSQFDLAVQYDFGQGVSQDKEKAVYWYTKAAEQGHAMAQNNLGSCYKNGEGVSIDSKKAIYWYTKAADQGVEMARKNLNILKSKNSKNASIIGAIVLGFILLFPFGFLGLIIGAIAGWFIGKKISEKM